MILCRERYVLGLFLCIKRGSTPKGLFITEKDYIIAMINFKKEKL